MKREKKLFRQRSAGKPKVVSLLQFKWRRAGQLLRHKLSEFADQPFFAQEAYHAQQIYVQSVDPSLVHEYDEYIMERFFEWFIFDYQLSTRKTVIELFRENPDLTNEEKELLKQWVKARLTLYEVMEVLSGKGVVLQELIDRNMVTVYDASMAQEIHPGMIFFTRVLKVGDAYEFSTSGLVVPAICKDVLLGKVHENWKTFCRQKGLSLYEGINEYLQENACLLNAWVMELGINYLFPRLVADHENNLRQTAHEITNVFLDEYCGQYIEDRMLPVGQGYRWLFPDYGKVASQVAEDLKGRGYNHQQIDSALRLWHDYCVLTHPSFRKAAVWVASIIYTMARLEFDKEVNQHNLAEKYGVATSTISANFRSLCRSLELVAFDRRYSTRQPVLSGLFNNYPLDARILKGLKL